GGWWRWGGWWGGGGGGGGGGGWVGGVGGGWGGGGGGGGGRGGPARRSSDLDRNASSKPSPVIKMAMAIYPHTRFKGNPSHCLFVNDIVTSFVGYKTPLRCTHRRAFVTDVIDCDSSGRCGTAHQPPDIVASAPYDLQDPCARF